MVATKKILEAQLQSALDEVTRLKQEATARTHQIDILNVELRNARTEAKFLKHELMSMQASNKHAIAVHRDAITLLLSHHDYKPRDIEWIDEHGKPLDVQLSPLAKRAIVTHAHEAQEAAYRDD